LRAAPLTALQQEAHNLLDEERDAAAAFDDPLHNVPWHTGRAHSSATPLVGREEELDLLGRRWERVRKGEGQLAPNKRLADLDNTLGLIGLDPTEYAPLLAPLVDVLLPEDRAAKHAPEEIRRRQLAAMTAWILASVRTQAVVLAFEDLDWADPTSLDLMRVLAKHGAAGVVAHHRDDAAAVPPALECAIAS
jgi:predicted ATPase